MSTKHYIVRTIGLYGSWGKGETLLEAANACKKAGGKSKDIPGISIICDGANVQVDNYGAVCYGGAEYPNAECIEVGYAKLSGLILDLNLFGVKK